jgi:hypothetical protein
MEKGYFITLAGKKNGLISVLRVLSSPPEPWIPKERKYTMKDAIGGY